jgi:EAL domain-containing protein (putative c-di-GMP-specific phosphodiesterase class I)
MGSYGSTNRAQGDVSRRILVVDDDPLVLRSLERALLRAGYTVHTATDVKTALRWAADVTIHAALVDYGLGREDGLAILSRMREIQPSCVRVLMTGRLDFPVVVEAINQGEVVRVLRKPFETNGLLALLDDAFASARRMEEVATAKLVAGAMEERRQLDECMNRRLLRLALQPILKVSGARAMEVAHEALLRPQHQTLNTPISFLGAAERHSRLADVGSSVFNLAAGVLGQLPSDQMLFVNVHPAQLSDPDRLLRDLEPLIASSSRVTLEITERRPLHDIARWDESVKGISRAGFKIAIDDLGAGYSSLTMLADLKPQFIKLDMSLVRNIENESRKQRLVQLMVTFADATNAQTIAEGVETAEESAALVDCGIHLMQGFFYGRPDLASIGSS